MSDIRLKQGDTYVFDVYATRNDEVVNLLDALVWFTMKRNRRDVDADALVKHDSTDPSQQVRIINAEEGIIRVKILPPDTVDLPPSYYPYDVRVKEGDADETVSTIEDGFVEVERATTTTLS